MKYSISSASPANLTSDCLVLPIWNKTITGDTAKLLDTACNKAISKILRNGDLTGKLGETLIIHNLPGIAAKRLLLVGCGDIKKLDAKQYIKMVNACLQALQKSSASSAHFLISGLKVVDRDADWAVSHLVQAIEQNVYRYDRTKSKKAKKSALKSISINLPTGKSRKTVTTAINHGKAVGKGINTARELGNLPGNVCTPTFLAAECNKLATRFKSVKTQVLSENQMQRLGMGSLLSVSAGSVQEAKLIVMKYTGTSKAGSKPHVLVGKGITFDTGGISLKPGSAMDEMKFDMCGAASVVGTMTSVAELKLPINVIGIIAAAENMPGSKATKPGDVVTSMSGKTIEILNTDAEGRLVLCDALTYAERFKPKAVIDIATLTGAAVATFGNVFTALLGNNQKLADTLLECGQDSLDSAWQLPLWQEYQPLLNSRFADIANIGGPRAGTITAACFLSRFAEKYHWAHLDIAGSAWKSGAEKAATGRPVGLLVEFLRRQKA